MGVNEQKAIIRLQQGDINGLEFLVHTYQVQARGIAYLIVHDRTLAEDIVQAAFLRAYERIHQFDPTRPFRPWFLRSVVNAALKIVTQQGRLVSLEQLSTDAENTLADVLPQLDPALEEQVEQTETREEIFSLLSQLSSKQRVAIIQRYYLDMTEKEMALLLSCPPSTIKRRLSAARARLRRLLEPLRARNAQSNISK